jgi:hypothetical protein
MSPPAKRRGFVGVGSRTISLEARLAAKVVPHSSGCHLWTGATTPKGYGKIRVKQGGRTKWFAPHRVAYRLAKGEIPEGYEIDHLCRNRACCNPQHLEAVSKQENNRRSNSWSAKNARATECRRGHPLSGDNLLKRVGRRECKACHRERSRALRAHPHPEAPAEPLNSLIEEARHGG